ncbi:hypothetical protein ACFV1W_10830 [Kitasatospora sp. NPDC059648]|uniref:hypothetical protein n=1 Tax=Kitasatospora sp. NPDC059648 TaxID=3346894 RepID=UPI003676A98A
MTDPLSSTTPQAGTPLTGEQPEVAEVPPLSPRRRRAERLRAWAGGRERRIAASVAAVALLAGGGLAVAAAAHEGHGERGRGHEHGYREAAARSENGHGNEDGNGQGNGHGNGQAHGNGGRHGGQQHGGAPAPLPPFAASAALEKAQAAVPGGRAESLHRVTAQGGGAAWAVTVVGQDGVRHLVTVDGIDGQLTSNTVVDGSEG